MQFVKTPKLMKDSTELLFTLTELDKLKKRVEENQAVDFCSSNKAEHDEYHSATFSLGQLPNTNYSLNT